MKVLVEKLSKDKQGRPKKKGTKVYKLVEDLPTDGGETDEDDGDVCVDEPVGVLGHPWRFLTGEVRSLTYV